jgi:type II secretory pathway pseudopilin PulG
MKKINIELLVLIIIVGSLISFFSIALSDAGEKSNEASIKSNLTNIRSQGEIFYNVNTINPNSFIGVCTNGVFGGTQGLGSAILAAAKFSLLSSYNINPVSGGTTSSATCNESANAWAVEVPLKSGGMWCVDSTAKSKKTNTSIGTNTFCL